MQEDRTGQETRKVLFPKWQLKRKKERCNNNNIFFQKRRIDSFNLPHAPRRLILRDHKLG